MRDIQCQAVTNEQFPVEYLGESTDNLAHWALDEDAVAALREQAAPEYKSGCLEVGVYSVRDIQYQPITNERLPAKYLGESADNLAHWALYGDAVEAVRDQAAVER